MKHLFFVAVTYGIFSGSTISVKAQANPGTERSLESDKHKFSPKFIENIEIIPPAIVNTIRVQDDKTLTGEVAFSVSEPGLNGTGLSATIESCSSLQFRYALMIDRDVESITNLSLYSFIDNWWGTPYQYGGADSTGIDCSAFTGKLLSEVYGLTIPRVVKDQYKNCEKRAIEELAEGDLVFFKIRGSVRHVGVYLGNNYFVHCSVHNGVMISRLTDEYYSTKFISGGRIIAATVTGQSFTNNALAPDLPASEGARQ